MNRVVSLTPTLLYLEYKVTGTHWLVVRVGPWSRPETEISLSCRELQHGSSNVHPCRQCKDRAEERCVSLQWDVNHFDCNSFPHIGRVFMCGAHLAYCYKSNQLCRISFFVDIFIPVARQPQLTRSSSVRFHDYTHLHTSQSVGLLWKSDQSAAEISIWQHTTDRHLYRWRDSKP
jgi:hypothetical protein